MHKPSGLRRIVHVVYRLLVHAKWCKKAPHHPAATILRPLSAAHCASTVYRLSLTSTYHLRLPSIVCRSPSTVSLPSIVFTYRLPSTTYLLPSPIYRLSLPSGVYRLPSAPSTTINRVPPLTARRPPSTHSAAVRRFPTRSAAVLGK